MEPETPRGLRGRHGLSSAGERGLNAKGKAVADGSGRRSFGCPKAVRAWLACPFVANGRERHASSHRLGPGTRGGDGSGSQAAPYRRDISRNFHQGLDPEGEPHPGSSPRPVQVSTGRSGRRRKSKALRASRTRRDQPRLTGGHITYMVRSVKDKGGKLGFERLDLSPKGFLLVE